MKNLLGAFAAAAVLALSPFGVSPQSSIKLSEGCAQILPGTGTCCPQQIAIGATPTENIEGYYYKSEGPC